MHSKVISKISFYSFISHITKYFYADRIGRTRKNNEICIEDFQVQKQKCLQEIKLLGSIDVKKSKKMTSVLCISYRYISVRIYCIYISHIIHIHAKTKPRKVSAHLFLLLSSDAPNYPELN